MGMFNGQQKNTAENIYEKQVKGNLKQKDGKIHVIMINSFSKWINQVFGVDDKYTVQIDEIISKMQDDDYEIIDLKFDTLKGQGLTGAMEGFHTIITYK